MEELAETRPAQIAAAHQALAALGEPILLEEIDKAAAVLADIGTLEADELQLRGLDLISPWGQIGVLTRTLPLGLAFPLERPRLRRTAYLFARQSKVDEAVALAAMAATLLTADLLRFDVETAAIRVRQTLLEDAPIQLLEALVVGGEEPPRFDESPAVVLQTALWGAHHGESPARLRQLLASAPLVAQALAGAWWAQRHPEALAPTAADYDFAALICAPQPASSA